MRFFKIIIMAYNKKEIMECMKEYNKIMDHYMSHVIK